MPRAGRKPTTYDKGPWVVMRRPEIQVSAIKPKVEHRLLDTYEDELEFEIKRLNYEGFTDIKAEQSGYFLLPRLCAKCDRVGRPVLRPYKRVISGGDEKNRKKPKKFEIIYNHSNPKAKCFVGYYFAGYIQPSGQIDPKKLTLPQHGPCCYVSSLEPQPKEIKIEKFLT